MWAVIASILYFLLICGLLMVNGYYLITLDELEHDHLNPDDVARKLNVLVLPEMFGHGAVLLVTLFSGSYWMFLLNLPLMVWHGIRFSKQQHLVDPTEILRYKKLKETRMEAIAKTSFYGFQTIYALYWMVFAIVSTFKRPQRAAGRARSKVPPSGKKRN